MKVRQNANVQMKYFGWIVLLSLWQVGCGSNTGDQPSPSDSQQPPAQSTPVAVVPDPVSLGSLEPGRIVQIKATLRNQTSKPVAVDSFESSCPCVSIESLPIKLPPNESAEATIKFDPTEEPDFRGSLSVELIGKDSDKQVLFRTRANLTVSGEKK